MRGGADAVLPFEGDYWNASGVGYGVVPLLTSTGDLSGFTMKVALEEGRGAADGDSLFGDYVFGEATIRGLEAGRSYHLVLYGAANLQSVFRVAQPFLSASPAAPERPCGYRHISLPGTAGCDYAEGFAVADAAGELTVAVHPGALSGLQISPVPNPEPSHLLLHLVAGGVVACRRRRGG